MNASKKAKTWETVRVFEENTPELHLWLKE
jgi:hypothetical protein